MEGERISLKTAADMLGISRVTAWRWARDGRLKAVMVGGRAYTTVEAVEECKREHIVEMTGPIPPKKGIASPALR